MEFRPVPQNPNSSDFLRRLKDSVFDLWFGTDKFTESQVPETLETLDASIQTLQIIPLPASTACHIHTTVIGVSSTDRATYEIIGTFYRLTSTAVSQNVTALYTSESDSSWNATLDVNGNDIRVRVSGAALWRASTKVTPLSN